MPTLRFARDKRGYETTAVVHTLRRRQKSRQQILYWFRTPPGVRVGRAPLDEEAIRLIEEHHPHIRFDWPQILRGDEEAVPQHPRAGGRERPREKPAPPPPDDVMPAAPPDPPFVDEPVSPAHARLGSEGLARLRARYAEVLAAISRRVPEESRREELKAEAEGLNPDTWVTEDEVTTGLDQYESVLASLRPVLGRRRRRKRSHAGANARGDQSAPAGPAEDEGPEEPPGDAGEGEPPGD